MQASRKDVGYTVYSRLEEALRSWLSEKLINIFGNEWHSQIPKGICEKAKEQIDFSEINEVNEPLMLLEETGIPDLMEIICAKNA